MDSSADVPQSIDSKKHDFHVGIFSLVVVLFALSGFSSLVYQVLWTRMLVFVFGSTVFASSTVLAVFMGGLALGAFFAGRYADRLKRPFLWYGILEGIIGIWAIFAPHLFDAAVPLYKAIWQQMHLSALPFSLVRFGVAAAILIIPTTCMGATLPLLSRFVTEKLDNVGKRVGTLYSVNTLGAVGGAVISGFVMLPIFGLTGTTFFAVAINLLLLIVVAVASKRYESGAVTELDPAPAKVVDTGKLPPVVIAAMVAFACSGAIAMVYEVAWTRTLLLVIGSSTYAFTIMLSTFLVGLFVGSLGCSRFADKLKNPVAWLAGAQALVCVGGIISLSVFNFIPYWNMAITASLGMNEPTSLLVRFLLSSAVLLPVTLFLGAMFPLVIKVCARELDSVGRSVGTVYASNTVGAIIGAFLAGFVIIPFLGVEKTLLWCSMSNLLIAAVLVYFLQVPVRLKAILATGAVSCLVLAATTIGIWDKVVLSAAQTERRLFMHTREAVPPLSEWMANIHRMRKVVFWEDGACASVGVLNIGGITSLQTNGHIDGSDSTDMIHQVLVGAYPMLFNSKAKNVAVVGWGTGVTIGTASVFPKVEKLVGIEIEPAVMRAAEYFSHVNLNPQKNPKVRLEVNDGRNYLLATDEKFDAIISQPSNPWQPGVCNLFTSEFFKVCKQRLNPDGVMGLWLQFTEISPEDLKRIFAALKREFKYTMPLSASGCMVVLASNEPLHVSYEALDAMVKDPKVARQLRLCGIDSTADLLARVICSSDVIDDITKDAQPNSDDKNYLEFNVGKTYESNEFTEENVRMMNANSGTPWQIVDWATVDKARKAQIMAQVAQSTIKMGLLRRGAMWAEESLRTEPNPEAFIALSDAQLKSGNRVASDALFAKALALAPSSPKLVTQQGLRSIQLGDIVGARELFSKALKLDPKDKDAQFYLAGTYTHIGRGTVIGASSRDTNEEPSKVVALLGNLPADPSFIARHPEIFAIAGMANLRLNKLAVAKEQLLACSKLMPNNVLAWRGLGSIYMLEGDHLRAAQCWQRGIVNAMQQARTETDQAELLAKGGNFADAARILEHAVQYNPSDIKARGLLKALSIYDPKAKAAFDEIRTIGPQL